MAPGVHWRIKQATAVKIAALELAEIGENVFIQIAADQVGGYKDGQNLAIVYPCVLLTSENMSEEVGPWEDSENDSYIYPVRVFLADINPQRNDAREPFYTGWRETIRNLFRRGLPEVSEVADANVTFETIFDKSVTGYDYIVSGMTFRFSTSEPR